MPFIEIHFKGAIDTHWADWFQGLKVRHISRDEMCLSSEVADNSAIYGILSAMSSLRLTLISVTVTNPDGALDLPASSKLGDEGSFRDEEMMQ